MLTVRNLSGRISRVLILNNRIMRNSYLFGIFLLIGSNFQGYSQGGRLLSKDSAFIGAVLRQHNIYREELQLPSLVWSANLAADAQVWADHLAKINKGQHDQDIRGKEGENIFWGTAGAYSAADMVSFWGNEKKSFVYGVFPDCKTSGS